MTELCYEIWFTTLNNDKVLTEQTKNQIVLTVVQVKNWLLFQHTLLTKSFSFYSTRLSPAILRPSQVKIEQLNESWIRNLQYLYTNFFVYSIVVTISPIWDIPTIRVITPVGTIPPIWDNSTTYVIAPVVKTSPVVTISPLAQSPLWWQIHQLHHHSFLVCSHGITTYLFRKTKSHVSLHMTDFNRRQWFYDTSRAYIFCLSLN